MKDEKMFGIDTVKKLLGLYNVNKNQVPDNKSVLLDNTTYEGVYGWYNRQTRLSRDRRISYYDYEQIAEFVLGSSALDMYVEDAFPYNQEKGSTVWITSSNEKLKRDLDELVSRLDLETLIPNMAYVTALYGDDFRFLALKSGEGVIGAKEIMPYSITRVEDEYGILKGFTPGIWEYVPGRGDIPQNLANPWDVLHTRIISKFTKHTGHGTSMLEPVRFIWKQLKIMLDSAVLYRWTRGVNRLVFRIDTGTNSIEEQLRITNWWKKYFKKRERFDPSKEIYEQEWNPESIDEDIFFPANKGSESKIEQLSGSANVGEIADIQMYVNLFFAGLRIPKAFMGFEGEILAREVLPYQSIRYANSAYKLQRAVVASLVRLFRIHATLRGYDLNVDTFKVNISTISHLYDVAKSELLEVKMSMLDKLLEFGDKVMLNKSEWLRYILLNYLDLDDTMIKKLLPLEASEGEPELDSATKNGIHATMKNNPQIFTSSQVQNLRGMKSFFNNEFSSDQLNDYFPGSLTKLVSESSEDKRKEILRKTIEAKCQFDKSRGEKE